MKIRIVLINIIVLLAQLTFSQNVFKGKIIDFETKEGIPFASIIYLNDPSMQGGYTDSLGTYSIKALDLELKISCIGYNTLKLKGSDLLLNKVIQLKPLVYELGVVEVKPRKNIVLQLGYFKNKMYSKLVMNSKLVLSYRKSSNYIIQHIKNEMNDDNLLITKLKFNLSNHFKKPSPVNENGCEATLLRVHLFQVDPTGKPGKELLTKNLIFKNDCQTDNLIVDVTNESVYLPQSGIFVGLEFIDNFRSSASSSYPFYVLNIINDRNISLNTYISNHQEKWETLTFPILGKDGHKYTAGFNAQFGIEVRK